MEIINVTDEIIEINVTEAVVNIVTQTGAYPLPSNVFSVFGRVGNVVGQAGDYTTSIVAEGTNLYYTNARSRAAISENITGINYDNATGVFSMASGYSLPSDSIQATWTAAYNDKINSASVSGTTTKTLTLNQQDGGTITTSWTDDNTDAVTSVFGRTGSVIAQSGDYNSLQVTENTNLYFTDQRARFAISGNTNSGVVYQNTTGIIALDDIPNTSLLNDKVTINSKDVSLGGSLTLTTTDVAEGTNLYFTNARAQNALTYGNLTSGDLDVSGGTAAVIGAGASMTLKTVNSNVGTYGSSTAIPVVTVNGKGLVTAMSTTAVSIPSGALNFIGDVTGSGTTGSDTTLTLKTVNSNVGEYGDSVTIPTVTVNAKGLVTAASETAIPTASGSTTGLLTSTDWTTFNNKQAALNGTGFVKASGTTISYDNSTYLTSVSGITAGGELSGTYPNPTLVNSAVTGKILSGVNITGGTIQDTDSILTAFGKVQNQINGLIGGSIYKGTWNASTNTPTLASGVGAKGDYYIVSVSGTTTIDGISDWNVGDWIIYDGTAWQQVDNTDAVVSVNGYTGAVSLTTSDISEGTNQYFTTTRARAANSAGTGISYSGGVITNTAPDQVVALSASGTTSISGTYPNFTIASADQYVGTVTSVGLTMPSAFAVSGSPITSSGTFAVTATGDTTQYIAGDGSLVTFPTAGQAGTLIREVRNETGATLTKGTVVYISGASGNKALVSKAIATGDSTSAQTFGIVQSNITTNQNGYVVCIGDLEGLNTLDFTEGTQLYLSSTTAGEYTSTKQYAPAHLVYIGIVTRSHANQGRIEVNIQNGYEMDELHNVAAQNPNDGDILKYVSSTSLWTKTAGTTTNIAEGTNLYYTDARARAAISETATGLDYNNTSGVLSITSGYAIPTTGSQTNWDTAYTNRITSLTTTGSSGAATLTSNTLNIPTYTLAGLGGINLTSLSATSPLLYDNTTGVFSIQQASGSQAGFLAAADWTTFNNKVPSTRTLSINGTAYDLSADRSWTITPNVNATYTQDYTATAAQTTFTVTGGYTVGQLAVFYNGFKLAAAEFTATNGTTFVLATACQANDIVQAVVSVTGGGIGGSGTTNYLAKFSASGVIANSLLFDNGTNVGIGTASPQSILHIVKSNSTAPTSGTTPSGYALSYGGGDGNNGGLWFSTDFGGDQGISGIAGTRVSGYQTDLRFYTNNTNSARAFSERMRIAADGKVGIGTNSPTYALDVQVANNDAHFRVKAATTNVGTGNIIMESTTTTAGTSRISGLYSSNNGTILSGIATYLNGTTNGGDIEFQTASGGSNAARMRITSGGQVLINTSTPAGVAYNLVLKGGTGDYLIQMSSNNGSYTSDVYQDSANGFLYFRNGSCATYLPRTAGNWVGNSDKTIKENLVKITNALDKLSKINGYYYNLIDDKENKLVGVIAQEVAEVLPEVVHKSYSKTYEKEILGVEYSTMIPLLINAIQEQQAQIDELKQLINK